MTVAVNAQGEAETLEERFQELLGQIRDSSKFKGCERGGVPHDSRGEMRFDRATRNVVEHEGWRTVTLIIPRDIIRTYENGQTHFLVEYVEMIESSEPLNRFGKPKYGGQYL